MPAIIFDQVSKYYQNFRALNQVSFQIEQGQFFGLLGPNGAGKSTLINCLAGLVTPSMGKISVMGNDVNKAFRQVRRDIGLVPQELISDPFFSIKELLEIQSGYFGLKGASQAKWIGELLERLALSDKADQLTNRLSGGMKRRVLIAMALVHKPQVLVLDEPTAGVDVDLRRTLWAFTKELHQQGHTIILTTHYLEEAEALCEKLAILKDGEVKALDSTHSLLSKHPFRFLRVTVASNSVDLPPQLRAILVSQESTGFTFKLDKNQPINEVLGYVERSGLSVQDVSTRDASLEEVFLDLVEAKS